jgi:hypothetical protein
MIMRSKKEEDRRVRGAKRRAVVERAVGRCEYCRSPEYIGTQIFSVEHITPWEQGGGSDLENLALACSGCNGSKYTKREAPDPATGKMAPLFHPRKEHWKAHFAWSEDAAHILGTTPTGRATVEALKMNRIEVVRFRRVLFLAGEHPPVE